MNKELLTTMANDIAAFFRSAGNADGAQSTAAHIRRYWDPRMRRQIVEHLEKGGEGLSELARAAIVLLSQESMRA